MIGRANHGGACRMKPVLQLLAMLVVIPATYLLVFWGPLAFVSFSGARWIPMTIALACALAAGGYVWRKIGTAPDALMASATTGAVTLGALGFVAGFFGPLIFSPGSNQGPMLGLFITGPLGVVFGAVGGAVYWRVRSRGRP